MVQSPKKILKVPKQVAKVPNLVSLSPLGLEPESKRIDLDSKVDHSLSKSAFESPAHMNKYLNRWKLTTRDISPFLKQKVVFSRKLPPTKPKLAPKSMKPSPLHSRLPSLNSLSEPLTVFT